MHWVRPGILLFLLLPLTGCGTFHNLKDSPDGPMFMGTGCCYPFGGVTRSGLLAVMGTPVGLVGMGQGGLEICKGEFSEGFKQIGTGAFFVGAGLIAIVDTPLSLAGDIVTYPIVRARSQLHPWATWWGEKAMFNSPWPAHKLEDEGQTTSEEAEQKQPESKLEATPREQPRKPTG